MRLRLPLTVCVLSVAGLLGVLLTADGALAQGKGKGGGKKPLVSAPASTKPVTAAIPADTVTLQLTLRTRDIGKKRPRDLTPTKWDGTVTLSHGRVTSIRTWRGDPRDSTKGSGWKLSTHRLIPRMKNQLAKGYENMPFRNAGLTLELAGTTPQTKLSFATEQGDFSFTLADIAFGVRKPFLKGLGSAMRIPNTAKILVAPTEDDFPSAAAAPDGSLYVAYVAFTHGKDFRARLVVPKPLEDFKFLDQPVGGDQVLLLKLKGGKWTGPLAVTPTDQDVFRTATAVDGKGRAWMFWTAKKGDAWNLFARSFSGGAMSKTLQVTDTKTPDIFPVATTDKAGRVWVAWQAFGKTNSDIVAARQEGDGFGKPIVVADGPGNEWTPAIAASKDGKVAVAWDTYGKGDYDVHCRVWSGGTFGETVPVATSARGEMRPSISYDPSGRLWIAYESAPDLWGKDFGALEQQGAALYRERTVDVRVLADGKLKQTAMPVWEAFALPSKKDAPVKKKPSDANKFAVPRIVCDAAGRVWLAARSPRMGERGGPGTTWYEHLVVYQNDAWSTDFVVPKTDSILDNRPALVAKPDGSVVYVGSTDGRQVAGGQLPSWLAKKVRDEGGALAFGKRSNPWPDRINSELMMAEITPPAPGTKAAPKLVAVVPPKPGVPDAWTTREVKDIARMRKARTTVAGKTVQIWRGEFHRHTELSGDGGGDGLLMDMWRYAIDIADFDWIGNGDHDNGGGREYSWWITQKTTDMLTRPGVFVPMFTYERSNSYPDGHRNVVFDRRGIRTLPRFRPGLGKAMDDLPADAKRPNSPDTQMLYRYLKFFDGICASHTSGTDMGTDWRDSDRKVEPVVEIYQGDRQNYEMPGAPRSNTAQKSIGGWRPLGFVSRALKMGIRFGFQASSDHISTHMSYCNVWVEAPTREATLAALKRRHVYGATDNIIADVQCGEHFMGDAFTTKVKPTLRIKLVGTEPFAKVHIIKDGNYVHTAQPKKREVDFQWTDFAPTAGATSYYYVRGEQEDGELVWVSPMWITYQP